MGASSQGGDPLTSSPMSELGPSPLAARENNLSVAQARAAIAERLRPIAERETVPLAQALGRVDERTAAAKTWRAASRPCAPAAF